MSQRGVSGTTSLLALCLDGDLLVDIPVALFAMVYIWQQSHVALILLLGCLILFAAVTLQVAQKIEATEDQFQSIDTAASVRQREALKYARVVRFLRATEQLTGESEALSWKTLALKQRLLFHYLTVYIFSRG